MNVIYVSGLVLKAMCVSGLVMNIMYVSGLVLKAMYVSGLVMNVVYVFVGLVMNIVYVSGLVRVLLRGIGTCAKLAFRSCESHRATCSRMRNRSLKNSITGVHS